MKPTAKQIAIVLAAAMLAGCGPQDLHSCLMTAAQAPTERGASLASAECRRQFEPSQAYSPNDRPAR